MKGARLLNKYIVKERRSDGFYRKPWKKGGGALRWTKWQTVSSHGALEEALDAAIVTAGLACRAVFCRGKQISDGPQLRLTAPAVGLRFRHARLLAADYSTPLECVVTAVRQGDVYYRPVEGGSPGTFPLADWDRWTLPFSGQIQGT
jgi:hypothetical protein